MTETKAAPSRIQFFLPWIMILVASPIGIIPWRTLGVVEPFWLQWLHGGILVLLFLTTLVYSPLKPHRRFAFIIVTLFFMGYASGWNWGLISYIRATDTWIAWEAAGPKVLYELSLHSLRLAPALIILIMLLLTGRKRKDFFLTKGDMHATVEPSPLLKTDKPEPWIKIALIFALVFVAVAAIFLLGANSAQLGTLTVDVMLIPVALLIAAMNGFNEEFTLRAAPLGELEPTMGKSDSLIVTAAYFGLGHYYGVPNGIIGVALSGFLGWLLGKSMLETRGFFVAWLVHFLTDVPIFIFLIAISF